MTRQPEQNGQENRENEYQKHRKILLDRCYFNELQPDTGTTKHSFGLNSCKVETGSTTR